ncbi:MAG: BTAD domain-containing putative transcriptional regulator [Ilumatobacteraceae bacterium]
MAAVRGQIPRVELVQRALAARICLIEAPGGFGKSTLAQQVTDALEATTLRVPVPRGCDTHAALALVVEAARQAGLADLAAGAARTTPASATVDLGELLAERRDPVCIVLDDVDRLDPAAAEWTADLIAALPASSHAIVCARQLPEPIGRLGRRDDAIVLVAADLRFGAAEIASLLVELGAHTTSTDDVALVAHEVLRRTEGWPAAVELLVTRRLASRTTRARGPRTPTDVMTELVEGLLAECSAIDRERIGRLATPPLMSAAVADVVAGPGALDVALRVGLPWSRRVDGWLRLPDPVRDVLGEVALGGEVRRQVARLYCDAGAVQVAVRFMHAQRDLEGLAEVVAERRWVDVEHAGVSFVRVVLALLGGIDEIRNVDLLLTLARGVEHDDRPLRRDLLARADVLTSDEATARRREVVAELARDASRGGDFERGDQLAHEVLTSAGSSELRARAQALFASGMAETFRCTPVALARAQELLRESAELSELAGEFRWASDALLRLGYAVSFHGGQIDAAIADIERALALAPVADRDRAVALTYAMDVLDHAGRIADAEAAGLEALEIGRRLGDQMVIGFACWSSAWVAAHAGDHEATLAWLHEVEQHAGRWMEEGWGAEFALTAGDMLAGLGDESGARRYFELGCDRARRHGIDDAIGPAEARIEACFGDPVRAEAILADLDGRPFAVPRNRWLRSLLRALAAHRVGDADAARSHLATARLEAARCGYPDLPQRQERWIVEHLAVYDDQQVEGAAAVADMRLLGDFCLRIGGEDRTPPAGHPATLLKLVALRGPITAAELIEALWPEVDETTGRSRLRNTLNRMRNRSGNVVVRRGELLAMAAGVTVDAIEFEAAAAAALAAPSQVRAGLARQAVARYRGDLLPGDRYAEWAAAPRERLRRRYLALTDLLADDAEARGDTEEAVRQLDAAMAVEPLDDRRPVRAARLLIAQGRRSSARELVVRAMAVVRELGVPPGAELAEVAAELSDGGG